MSVRQLLLPTLLAFSPAFLTAGSFDGELNPPCAPGTLASYISNEAGCSIGIIDYMNFQFGAVGGPGQTNIDNSSQIYVIPAHYGFTFTQTNGLPFLTTGNQFTNYHILYDFAIDPAPIIDGADLSLDPPSGGVRVTQYYCNDSTFALYQPAYNEYGGPYCEQGTGPGSLYPGGAPYFIPESLTVTPTHPDTGFVPFTRKANYFGSVLTEILLSGNAQFDAVTGNAFLQGDVPEPAVSTLVLFGLGLIAIRRKRSANS